MHDLVVKNYIKEAPRYITAPTKSRISILNYEDYKSLSVRGVQSLLRTHHLLITDIPIEQVVPVDQPVSFDAAGLQLLKNLEAQIPFQG
jgi:hypothetical protein